MVNDRVEGTVEHRLRVGVDLDECVYPFVDQFREWLVRQGWDRGALSPARSWRFWEEWGLDEIEFRAQFTRGVLDGFLFRVGDPVLGSVEALAEIAAAGHHLIVVTDRNVDGAVDAARVATWCWLVEHVVPRVPLTGLLITADKGSVDTDVFFEDSPVMWDLLDRDGATVPVWVDRPWNQGRAGLRVMSWGEVPVLVAELTHSFDPGGGVSVPCVKCGEWFSRDEIRVGLPGVCPATVDRV